MRPDPPGNDYFRMLFDAIPSPVVVVDADVRVEDANRAGTDLLGAKERTLRRKGGDILHCIQAGRSPGGCGHGPDCGECAIRGAVGKAIAGETVTRSRMRMEAQAGDAVTEFNLLITAAPFAYEGRSLALLVLEDIGELVALRSLLPVCAWCKKVRTDDHYWQNVEEYLRIHAGTDVSHSICEECLDRQLKAVTPGGTPPFQPPVRK